VTRRVDAGEVVEELPALGYELEQSPPGVIILDVGLEMLGKASDAFPEDRHPHFRRTGVAGFGRIGLDNFGLAARRDRHRDVPFLSGFRSAAVPGCGPARSPSGNARALQRFPANACPGIDPGWESVRRGTRVNKLKRVPL